MRKLNNQVGGLNVLLIPLILASLMFIGSLAFGFWAYGERNDYKNNVDQKIDSAVQVAVDKNSSDKDNSFLEKEKLPTRTYVSSAILGSVTFKYPKTWSGYFDESDKGLEVVMQKGLVNMAEGTTYPLTIEVLDKSYDAVAKEYEANVKNSKMKSSPFRLKQMPDILGIRFNGEIPRKTTGTVILLPQREKTIRITSETEAGVADLDNIILPDFKYTP